MSSRLSKICSVHTYYVCYAPDGLFWLNLYFETNQDTNHLLGCLLNVLTKNGKLHVKNFSSNHLESNEQDDTFHLILMHERYIRDLTTQEMELETDS